MARIAWGEFLLTDIRLYAILRETLHKVTKDRVGLFAERRRLA